jgi:hypothetical protein
MLAVGRIVAIGVEYNLAVKLHAGSRPHLVVAAACQQDTKDNRPSPPEYLVHLLHHPHRRYACQVVYHRRPCGTQ